jgi:hypothetical protein
MPNIGVLEIAFLLIALGIPASATVALVWRGRRHGVDGFAAAHGLELTEQNRTMIAAYVRRSFRWRMAGAVIGALVPFGTNIPGVEMIAGYLVGAIAAELSESRVQRGKDAAASLVPRHLNDYLSPLVLRIFRGVAGSGILVGLLYFFIPLREDLAQGVGTLPFLVVPLAIVAVASGVEAVLRLIVHKPQPADEGDVVAVDDAIRSASIHAVAGAGLALLLLLAAAEFLVIGGVSDFQIIRWVFPVLAAISTAAAFVVWVRFGNDISWHVARSFPVPAVPV